MDRATIHHDSGVIFNIQRFSLHDGNGIRTIVFMKGCPLRCVWCANPESQNASMEVSVKAARCIGCGTCEDRCANHAIRLHDGTAWMDRSQCTACGACVESCNAGALSMLGESITVETLFKRVMEDKVFYDVSHGGVTFSGGEPLLQPIFLKKALERFQAAGVSTVLETCGCAPREVLESVRPMIDTFYFDVKVMNREEHKRFTGVPNDIILDNLAYLQQCDSHVLVRMPLIPGVNDSVENLSATGAYLRKIGIPEIQLLPYHSYGASKYPMIGQEYTFSSHTPSEEEMECAKQILVGYDVKVKI